jgi:hypothetical protein
MFLGGWMEVKAVLRIAFSNQKLTLEIIILIGHASQKKNKDYVKLKN